MRIRSIPAAMALVLVLAPGAMANRIPGIPIMIKCPCPGPTYVEGATSTVTVNRYERDAEYVTQLVRGKWALSRRWAESGQFARR